MRFYLSNQNDRIDRDHLLWSQHLPVSPDGERPAKEGSTDSFLTYGEYFSTVEAFIRSVRKDKGLFFNAPLENVAVFLEKHGAFYHPSRIVVPDGDRRDEYVLNVAFSEMGRQYLEKEYRTLAALETKYGYPFLPRVFACREVPVDDSRTAGMFLGEWFSGHHEFHVSDVKVDGGHKIRVWDPDKPECFLSLEDAGHLYTQAAMILTACYDIQTFDHVSAWHHAAGDFVVKLGESRKPKGKLVTVRRYAPLISNEEDSAEAMVNCLLLFFFNLSIRMRLDRVDGVKALCWVDDFIVPATVDGFYQGLALQGRENLIPENLVDYFKSYLAQMTAGDMLDLFISIADRLPEHSVETPLIAAQIERHAKAFSRAVRAYTDPAPITDNSTI